MKPRPWKVLSVLMSTTARVWPTSTLPPSTSRQVPGSSSSSTLGATTRSGRRRKVNGLVAVRDAPQGVEQLPRLGRREVGVRAAVVLPGQVPADDLLGSTDRQLMLSPLEPDRKSK